MTIFDLLFLVLFLAGVGTLIVATIGAVRGRRARAGVIVRRLGIVAALYLGAVILVSAFTPQRFIAVGTDQCSDDWCIAVQTVRRDSTSAGIGYAVTFRLSSRARRVAQRERFVAVYLRDQTGHRYTAAAEASAIPFDTLLHPQEAVATTRRFLVPTGARVTGLVVVREGGGRFPGCCIIGDQASLFHRPTIVKLE